MVKKNSVKADEDEDDSDFEDPDMIEVPGGGKSLQTLQKFKTGDGAGTSMPSIGGLGELISILIFERRQEGERNFSQSKNLKVLQS